MTRLAVQWAIATAVVLAVIAAARPACGQPAAPPPDANKPTPQDAAAGKVAAQIAAHVAARVDGEPIYDSEVRRELAAALGSRQLALAMLAPAQAATLERLIDRQLVLAHLAKSGLAADRAEVDQAVERLRRRLADRKRTLAEHLAQTGQTLDELRRQLTWQLTWQRHVERELTDAALEKHFQQHRRQFDGAQLRVSHVLFRLPDRCSPRELNDARQRAEAVRNDLAGGRIAWADAVRRHSDAPSKSDGGDLGYIGRHGPQDEDFSRAAFALAKGQISGPIVTRYGVHLLLVTEEKPGDKKWTEVREALTKAAAADLFARLAAHRRPAAKIEYTGLLPHFRPGTQELVTPPPR